MPVLASGGTTPHDFAWMHSDVTGRPGPLRLAWRALRSHPRIRRFTAGRGADAYRRVMAARPGVLPVDIDRPMGMGALLMQALIMHHHAERHGLTAQIVSSSRLYAAPGEDDFLARWFERPPAYAPFLAGAARDNLFWHVIDSEPDLAAGSALLARHFRPTRALLDPVEAALAGRSAFDLSVHFRGTDKVSESGEVHHDALFAALDPELERRGGVADLFLATDEPAFAKALSRRWPRVAVTMFERGAVPPGQARHFSALAPHDKALEALGNIWLLARAPLCIRTSSFLSGMARLVNPALVTRTVNRAPGFDARFPERGILAEEAARDVGGA